MGSYVISVSLGTGCYRHIQISSSATLFRLHQAILNAFEFEDDHMHAFFMDNKRWSQEDCYVSSKSEPTDRLTKRYSLEKAGVAKGKKFLYLFDFGDEWVFQCKVLRELDEKTDIPGVVRSAGEAPEQYPQYDEDWEEYEWDMAENIPIIPIDPKQPRIFTDAAFPPPPEDEELWPDYDYEGFPTLRSAAETLKALEKLPIPQGVWNGLWDYFEAAARLYGVISLRKLLEIYNRHNAPISEELFLEFAEILRHDYRPFSILNCDALKKHMPMDTPLDWEIVAEYVYANDINDYYIFTQLQGDTPFRVLQKTDFLRYSKPDYHPNTVQVKAMRQFLKTILEYSEDVENILMCIQELCEFDMGLEETLDILAEEGLSFERKKDLNIFLSLYRELNDHTRKCIYRVASADFGVKLPDRERKDVIRNKSADSRFDVLKYKDLYVFMLNTGLRRKELKLIQPEDVTMEEGKCMIHVRCGKGGKVRNFAVLSAEPYRIAQEAMLAGAELIFLRIPKYCACHYYRKVFATSLYILHMEDLETLSREEKYYCAKELQGVVLAKKAMWIVSNALGHGRLGVTTRYILLKPGDPECSEKAD